MERSGRHRGRAGRRRARTGNTVVHKPSERCPHTGALFGRLLAEHCPDGVLRTVSGDGRVGAALAGLPGVDVVVHVGGTATGRSIAAAGARTGTKVLLENGGNDPLIVDADVDPAWAAEQAALGAFANAGRLRFRGADLRAPRRRGRVRCRTVRTGRAVEPRPATAGGRAAADTGARPGGAGPVGQGESAGGRPDSCGPGTTYPATVLVDCQPRRRPRPAGRHTACRTIARFATSLLPGTRVGRSGRLVPGRSAG